MPSRWECEKRTTRNKQCRFASTRKNACSYACLEGVVGKMACHLAHRSYNSLDPNLAAQVATNAAIENPDLIAQGFEAAAASENVNVLSCAAKAACRHPAGPRTRVDHMVGAA